MNTARERVIDELLVIRCQAGEAESFDLLVRRWQRRLWNYARRLAGSDDLAWEVVQETWLVILRRINTLSDPAWFAAWAYRIVRNKCADAIRRRQLRRKRAEAVTDQQRSVHEPAHEAAGDTLADALQRLPAESREILTLKYVDGLSIVELAAVFDIPPGTVKSRLFHARDQMRRLLEGEEHEQAR